MAITILSNPNPETAMRERIKWILFFAGWLFVLAVPFYNVITAI